MKWRFPRHSKHILAYHIELDVISGVLDVMLNQEEVRYSLRVFWSTQAASRTIHEVDATTGAAIGRLDDQRITLPGDLPEQVRVGNEVAVGNGQPMSICIGGARGFVAHQSDRPRVIDRWNARRFRSLQDTEPRPVCYRLEDVGVVQLPSEVPQGRDRLGGLQQIDVVPRSEEHTSELQSRFDLVCRLLLEKKKI